MSLFTDLSCILRRSQSKQEPRPVSAIELHVAHACNLTCESCSHYSNHAHKGILELAQAESWMREWSKRITLSQFNLLGGEPTMNPHLSEFVILARKYWPAAHIRIITNGFFLHRHPELPSTLSADGNASLALSVHHNEPAYIERLSPIFDLLAIWQRDHSTIVETWQSHQGWTRRYLGFGPRCCRSKMVGLDKAGSFAPQNTANSSMKGNSGNVLP